jgi:two-component system, NarL family, response regulator LiaR
LSQEAAVGLHEPPHAPRGKVRALESVSDTRATRRTRRGQLPRLGPAVTVALVGGQRLLRDATASLLGVQAGLRVLGAYDSAEQFLALAQEDPPAVLLLDCDDDANSGWQQTLSDLARAELSSRIAILCRQLRGDIVRAAIDHRVGGVILKSYSTDEVRAAIEYVATGRSVMPAGWQRAVEVCPPKRLGLSPRHREILDLIACGRSNQEIATELNLSPNTIKFHVRAMYSRLGVRNRVEAASRHAQIASGGN